MHEECNGSLHTTPISESATMLPGAIKVSRLAADVLKKRQSDLPFLNRLMPKFNAKKIALKGGEATRKDIIYLGTNNEAQKRGKPKKFYPGEGKK